MGESRTTDVASVSSRRVAPVRTSYAPKDEGGPGLTRKTVCPSLSNTGRLVGVASSLTSIDHRTLASGPGSGGSGVFGPAATAAGSSSKAKTFLMVLHVTTSTV